MDEHERLDDALYFCAIVLLIALLLALFIAPWPPELSAWKLWTGEKGIIELIAALGTPAVATLAVFLAYRSYKLNLTAALATRFQKGAELLGALSDSAKIAGIYTLVDVSSENPKLYQRNVVRTMRQVLNERGAALVERVYEEPSEVPLREGAPLEEPPKFQRSGLVTAAALGAIARVPPSRRWLGMEYAGGRLRVSHVYLNSARIVDADFSRMMITSSVIISSRFIRCRFSDVLLSARGWGRVTLENCIIENSDFEITDEFGQSDARMRINQCDVIGRVILNDELVANRNERTEEIRTEGDQ